MPATTAISPGRRSFRPARCCAIRATAADGRRGARLCRARPVRPRAAVRRASGRAGRRQPGRRISCWSRNCAAAGDYDGDPDAAGRGQAARSRRWSTGWSRAGPSSAPAGCRTRWRRSTRSPRRPATRAFGLYHKALALALAGDYEAADAILSSRDHERLNLTRRGTIARVEILSQLERNADAVTALTEPLRRRAGPGAGARCSDRLEAGETLPFDGGDSSRTTGWPRCSSPSPRR